MSADIHENDNKSRGPFDPRYAPLIESILEHLARSIGHEETVSRASKVAGLRVSPYLQISVTRDPKAIISDLMKAFDEVLGGRAYEHFHEAIGPIKSKYPDLDLPPDLKYY